MSNWEDIILKSSNTEDNIKLMKLIILSIELNQKPFYLTGFNYFNVSLATVVTVSSNLYQKSDNLDNEWNPFKKNQKLFQILQGAGSYFTFLYAFR